MTPCEVVAGEIGVDAAGGDGVGLLLRGAGGPQQRRADARETVGLNERHGEFLFERPREWRGLLVVAACMVSKRWLDGKGRMSC